MMMKGNQIIMIMREKQTGVCMIMNNNNNNNKP